MSPESDNRIIERIERDLEGLEERLSQYVLLVIFEAYKEYVDQRMKPLERLVYGLVGLVLIAFVTALIGLVIVVPKG